MSQLHATHLLPPEKLVVYASGTPSLLMQTLGSLKRSFYLVAADVATAAASVRYCTGPIMGDAG